MTRSERYDDTRPLTEFERARAAGRLRPLGFLRGDATEAEILAFADFLAEAIDGNGPLSAGIDGAGGLAEHVRKQSPPPPGTENA